MVPELEEKEEGARRDPTEALVFSRIQRKG